MKELPNTIKAILIAIEKGYKIVGNEVISPKGNNLKLTYNPYGYPYINLRVDKKSRHVYLHKWIAYLKYGSIVFEEGIQVRHLNGNPKDFSDSNIFYGTPSQNQLDRCEKSLFKDAINATLKMRKYFPEQIEQIRKDREEGLSYNKLNKKYGISKGQLHYIVNHTYVSDDYI